MLDSHAVLCTYNPFVSLLVKINLFFFLIGSEYDYQVIGLRMHNIYRVQHGVPQLALNEAVSKFLLLQFFRHVLESLSMNFAFVFLKLQNIFNPFSKKSSSLELLKTDMHELDTRYA